MVVTGLGLKLSLRDCIDAKKLPLAFVTACQNFSYGAVSIAQAHHVLNELSNYRNGDDMNAVPSIAFFATSMTSTYSMVKLCWTKPRQIRFRGSPVGANSTPAALLRANIS